ncbi:ATP-binding cassette sub-family D member 3 [Zootermopsis nevadensis]|uniref:ATP-binding cassette sub-family D member 3 n=1 Tax=Zootermopsis nevadensis TaxID=136037 RepID=A0A067RKH0_ZOONE|nr:ATP-binding cassette sub-family D member 3 [Zootermopsis nevadensis]KDR21095.1 ATP-binding cassette sub-family D member 3 [Zootermopsis nevadensis]
MAPTLSKFVTKRNVAGALSVSFLYWLLRMRKKQNKIIRKPVHSEIQYVVGEKSPQKTKARVDAVFFGQLRYLLSIVIPGPLSSETGFLFLVAVALIARSLCDLWFIRTCTYIENAIVNTDRKMFMSEMLVFVSAMPVMSLVNNLLKYSIGEVKLRFRTRLTRYLYDQYLKGFTYYKMSNLDNRIANADQLLTTDVDKFCDTVTDLYSNISKPLLDIVIYVYRLTTQLGGKTPSLLIVYLMIAGWFLTYLRRPIARMTVTEQKLEGEFRYINSRLITNSEEVAFYHGNQREKLTLLASFEKLTSHLRKFLEFRIVMGILDNVVAKYVATVVGFYAVSIPFFDAVHPLLSGCGKEERFRHYYEFGRMMVKLAEAIGRLVLSGREMTRLAGFTARVTDLIKVLKDVNQGNYIRTMVGNPGSVTSVVGSNAHDGLANSRMPPPVPLIPGSGRIIFQDNVIRFDKVPLVTPNGDILVNELDFEVRSGINVLVCGPNGCGKSSLFRVLGELWPLFGGTLTKPPRGKLFYIPQRPYMTLGTLRDQVIYPHTHDEMLRRGKTDDDLADHLERVKLSYLLCREGGWDAIADWIDVLSGGEKQRIAMARLFYHQPQFAILDECTSAVSVDVEGSMYQYCREVGITLFTVSHRRSLWKHHEYYLQMDGRGSVHFRPIEPDTEEFGS